MACPICARNDLRRVAQLNNLPTLCNVLWSSASEAAAAPVGDLHLTVCAHCGLLCNAAFDPDLDDYSPAYDNSLHHSPRFQDFAQELVTRLVSRYNLNGRSVVEIGSGSADFLDLLCEAAACTAIGYDPSYDPSRARDGARDGSRVEIIGDYYPVDREIQAALVICEHVLEHVPAPLDLVSGVRSSMGDRTDVAAYFEVPDATYMLEAPAIWDLIYEHVSYFSEPTLRYLFERAGFSIEDSGRAFGDQYLWIEARPAPPAEARPNEREVARILNLSQDFGDRLTDRVSFWEKRLEELCADGPVALWGAGSKGVTFLNIVQGADQVQWVIDINPNKWGKFVPGTGQPVVEPKNLGPEGPRHVLVMNPLYADEIQENLTALGYECSVHVV